jgi:hypothetical protein
MYIYTNLQTPGRSQTYLGAQVVVTYVASFNAFIYIRIYASYTNIVISDIMYITRNT